MSCKWLAALFLGAGSLQLKVAEAAPVPPAPPDAGQTLRELQPPPRPEAPRAAPPLIIEDSRESHAASDVRFLIKGVRISGNREIPTEELEALVAGIVGAEHDLGELRAAVAQITDYYRQRGYPVARAYLPAQEIRDGVVTIGIIEGRVDKRVIQNQSRLSQRRADSYLARIKEGAVIRSADVDRGLLLLNETPGVGSSRATLQPGASVGTSELIIAVDRSAMFSGDVETDNHGNRYTGEYRFGGTLNINSPLHDGDQLALSGLTTGRELRYERASYQLPIGGDGLRFGAAYFDTNYRLGRDFSELQAHGSGTGASAFAVYPFVLTQRSSLITTVSLEKKHLTDYVDATATVTEKHVRVATLGVSASHWDSLAGGGLSSVNLSLARGNLDINSDIALLIDELSAQTNGKYTRLSYTASRLQRLTAQTVLSLTLSGQKANKNLDTSEKFSLGGPDGVRAYPQGEDIGDEGYMVNLEVRHNYTRALQGVLFYDAGSVTTSRNPFIPGVPNSRKLAGVGTGLNAEVAGAQIKAVVAYQTEGGEPRSIPSSAAHKLTSWVQVRKAF